MPTHVPYKRSLTARVGHVVHGVHERIEQRIAEIVSTRSDDWLERYPGPVFRNTLPLSLRAKYRAEKAITVDGKPLHGIIRLTVTSSIGRPDYRLEIRIAGRRCRIRHRDPSRFDAAMQVSLSNMMRMATGAAESSIVMSQGAIGVQGDPFLLAGFPAMFSLPSRPIIPTNPGPGA